MIKRDVRQRLDAQMALGVAESQNLYAAGPPAAADDLTAQRDAYNRERAFWNAIKPPLAAVEALTIPGPGGAIALRLFRPREARPLPALLSFHRGGSGPRNPPTLYP